MKDYKNIHIGRLIGQAIEDQEMEMSRICNFFKCSENEATEMWLQQNLSTDILLKWSKLLDYDFFRIYCQHLILYSPPDGRRDCELKEKKGSVLPRFRKNMYTREIIDFILEQIDSGAMSKSQIIEIYRIPKTTLYKWITKYKQ